MCTRLFVIKVRGKHYVQVRFGEQEVNYFPPARIVFEILGFGEEILPYLEERARGVARELGILHVANIDD